MRKTPCRIAFVGGSTVYGQGDPAGGGFVGRFRALFEPLNDRNRVFNLGVGGDTVSMMLKRAPNEVRARRADLILCYPGLNDIRRVGSSNSPHSDLATFKQDFEKLLNELSVIAPVVAMTAVPIDEARTKPFRDDLFFLESDAEKITAITKEVVSNHRIPLIDFFGSWSMRPDYKEFLADGLHCNSRGHAQLAQEVNEYLIREVFESV